MKEHSLPLFLLFIDYEKAYDNANRDKLWEMMDNKIPNYLLNAIKCLYCCTVHFVESLYHTN